MGLVLERIPFWAEGPPGWGGLCGSRTSPGLARSMGNVPAWGEHIERRTERSMPELAARSMPLTANHTSVSVGDRQLLPGSICGHGPAQPHPPEVGGLLLSTKYNKDTWLLLYQRGPFLLLSSPASGKLLFTPQGPAQGTPPPGSPPS